MQEMREEIERHNIEISNTPRASPIHTAMKGVTLAAGINDWKGDSKGRTFHEFFAQINTYAKVSNWAADEKALIRLSCKALLFSLYRGGNF